MNRNNFNNNYNQHYNNQQQSTGRPMNNNNPNFYHAHHSQSLNNFSKSNNPSNFNPSNNNYFNIPQQMGPPASLPSQNQMSLNKYQPYMNQSPTFNQPNFSSNHFKNSSSCPNINNNNNNNNNNFVQNRRYQNNQNNDSNYRNNYNRYNQRNFNNHNESRSLSRNRDSQSFSSNRYFNNNNNNNNNRNRDDSESDYNRKQERYPSQQQQPKPVHLYQQEADYTQTTSIPIYYAKHENKITKGTSKLNELCDRFKHDIIDRSRRARERENLPPESTKIPDYRQLIQTKKFDKFTRCTCDQPTNHNSLPTMTKKSCKKHKTLKRSDSSSSSSSSDSSTTCSSLSSSSCSSRSRSRSSSRDGNNKNSKKEETSDNEFDDIRSMEINRKQNHPERLHPDLSFNEPDQTNEGPLCKCKLKNTTFGTRHQIYYGESSIEPCDENTNNSDRLFHYRMNINPFDNFVFKNPTQIEYDKHNYIFEGYSLFSHEPLENIPDCIVVIYNHEYKINLVKEEMIENFTIKELELIKQFIFTELLELYDLKWKGYNQSDSSCNRFHVMPRFCRSLPYNGKEILSPCEILKYFLSNSEPVITETILAKCHLLTNREWLNYLEPLQGSIVTYPGKRPAALRLDQVDRDQIVSSVKPNEINTMYPLIIHFSMFRNTWLPMIKNNQKLKKLYHKYFKLRHLLNNKSKLTVDDKAKFRALGDELQNLIRKSTEVHKEIMIELSAANFLRTGIRTDIVQQTVLVPTFVEHLRFHLSLKYLEEKIGYRFKNRLLLQYALTHPSGAFLLHQNLGSNSDHIRNVLFNCKVRNPNYGVLTPQKRKSLLRKKGIHMLFSIMSQKANDLEESSCISNYERLEFLGDKILELLTSRHLFFMFPLFDEGQLSEYRNAIVQNQYLAILARKLDMHYFILFYHGVDLCSNSALNHALANSFEALLAAIFLDSDLQTVSDMLAKSLWNDPDTQDLYEIWKTPKLHPLQAQLPQGDRHLIKNTKILQHVNIFEDMIGVEFKHIRLLAQAFCTRSASFNLITLGDNQRLEFLGDTVLNFVVSDYLYRYFPNHHEGHLSLLRSSLVCNSTQALLYDELGMSDFVLTSYINNRKETNGNLKRKADVFEAFIGALYIDQGLEAVTVFCNVCMFNKLKDIILYQFWNDPKSRLQQCCLSLRDVDESKPSLPIYKLIEEKGPPNHKQYKVAVYFNRKRIGEGIGKSIHDAEVEAAKNALKTKADMFPVLNKYIANELKNSSYLSEGFKSELEKESSSSSSTNLNKKKKKNKNNKKNKNKNVQPNNNMATNQSNNENNNYNKRFKSQTTSTLNNGATNNNHQFDKSDSVKNFHENMDFQMDYQF